MGSRIREDLRKSVLVSTGWLFADLLLALAMLFLAVNTISQPEQTVHKPAPVAIPPQRLEQEYHRFIITINRDKLLGNDANEKLNVTSQVRQQTFLRGRTAGLVIVYGGAPTFDDIPIALSVARIVYSTLTDFGRKDATFAKVSKYDPLYLLGGDSSKVEIDIFLFAH